MSARHLIDLRKRMPFTNVIVKLKGTINVRLKGTTHESEKINEKNGNLSLLYLINKRLLNDMYSNVYNSINLVQAR